MSEAHSRRSASSSPDTAVSPFQTLLYFVHVLFLIGVGAVVLTAPLACERQLGRQPGGKLIAPIPPVASPADGVFKAVRPLAPGSWVAQGTILGMVEDAMLNRQFAAVRDAIEAHERSYLQLAARCDLRLLSSRDDAVLTDRELRESALLLQHKRDELRQVEAQKQLLVIRAPVSGRVLYGLPPSAPAVKDQPLTHIAPDVAEYVVEIEAPRDTIRTAIRRGVVRVLFETDADPQTVECVPHTETWSEFSVPDRHGRDQIWGRMQCRPIDLPPALRRAGRMARLID